MGEESFLSSWFADEEADVQKGPFAKEPGSGSNRGDSWLPASNLTWGDRKTVQRNSGSSSHQTPLDGRQNLYSSGRRWSLQNDLLT